MIRENEALDNVLDIQDLVRKCQDAEKIARQERTNNMLRFFVDIDKIDQVYVKKASKTASSLKIRYEN